MGTAYLGLGTNLGDRVAHLSESFRLLAQYVQIDNVSSIYQTEPEGFKEQPLFLNAICRIVTSQSPEDLLHVIKEIEHSMGRRPSFPNAPRQIDIDILLFDDRIITTDELVIPHPRFHQRGFVLVPLAEIDPELKDPRDGKVVRDILHELHDVESVRWYGHIPEDSLRRHYVSGIS